MLHARTKSSLFISNVVRLSCSKQGPNGFCHIEIDAHLNSIQSNSMQVLINHGKNSCVRMAPSLKRCIWMTINHHKPTNLEPNLSRRHPKTFTAHHSEVQTWCKFKRHLSIPGSLHRGGSRLKFNWACVSQTHQSQNVWYQSMESIPINRYQCISHFEPTQLDMARFQIHQPIALARAVPILGRQQLHSMSLFQRDLSYKSQAEPC